ncbi:MAG TPA: tetratricopeptide repeat protein [Candidatus Acidoferrum sp.]|nr:tetratricopeptide repeat protein [Candidatus Acidoferrum sp.]
MLATPGYLFTRRLPSSAHIRMGHQAKPVTYPAKRLVLALFSAGLSLAIPARSLGQQPVPLHRGPSPSLVETPVTVVVSVRETSGMPLPGNAFVKLSSDFSGVHLTAPTQDGSTATFPNIQGGEYEIEVNSTGYKTATEHASIMAGGSNFLVFIYMHPESEVATSSRSGGAPIVSPRLQSEIDKGMDKLRRQQYDAAREHLEKAAKMAPGNPDVQYLLGLLEYRQQHFDAARAKFEGAISIYPAHERSLVALGELLLRIGQPAQAAQNLEKAYQINGADWRTHLLLAYAYAAQKDYEKAAPHAVRAVELAKNDGAAARLLVGRVRAGQGKKAEAKQAFEGLIRDFPADPAAAQAKLALASMEKEVAAAAPRNTAEVSSAPPVASAVSSIPALPVLVRAWAPPDIDAKEYPVAADVSCSEDDLLQKTELRTSKQLANFEKFMATEHIEHQEIDANGNAGAVRARDFNYLVFVERPKKGYVYLEEERDGGENLASFPTSLASKGLIGLGVYLFDPQYESDLAYHCEGLGQWRGQPAWQLRFEQRAEAPSRIRTWRNSRGLFPVAMKGRVWVSANSYDVLHIETDLREPQKEIELSRDHLVIDYGPVQFEHGKTSLWLPWYAELFMELHGKRYHHRHTLTNYALFSVDTTHSVSPPKDARKEN